MLLRGIAWLYLSLSVSVSQNFAFAGLLGGIENCLLVLLVGNFHLGEDGLGEKGDVLEAAHAKLEKSLDVLFLDA